ncbi:825_t:CDS:2 [Rhizophagus irregularis]|nr:825_t:CDS:2 [Rhizophagus irregularis]
MEQQLNKIDYVTLKAISNGGGDLKVINYYENCPSVEGWQKKDNRQIFSTNKVHIRKRPVSANLREIQLVDLNILLEIFAP